MVNFEQFSSGMRCHVDFWRRPSVAEPLCRSTFRRAHASRWVDRLAGPCETGGGACDQSLLSPEQQVTVKKLESEQNLLACETGESICNDSLLDPSQRKRVAVSRREKNLLACRISEIGCDNSLLNSSEKEEVREANRDRSELACEAGEYSCDRSLLSSHHTGPKQSIPTS